MSSRFERARGKLRASITYQMGSPHPVTLPSGDAAITYGYVKRSNNDSVRTYTFYGAEELPAGTTVSYEGRVYALAFRDLAASPRSAGSQLCYEYTMGRKTNSESNHGWSEFPNVG